nr:MAG TPA: antirepressor [Caudoviricetes sp.]
METKTQNWCGYDIRFVEYCGTWYAVLKDICDALDLHTFKIAQRINASDLRRLPIPSSNIPNGYNRLQGENITRSMLVINEHGVYQALFRSRRLEARQFTDWVCDMLENMRGAMGLQPYEVMSMTEPEIQRNIDEQLGEAFYDPEKNTWRIQRTIENGDVLIYDKE